jgi:hypothetical protein
MLGKRERERGGGKKLTTLPKKERKRTKQRNRYISTPVKNIYVLMLK